MVSLLPSKNATGAPTVHCDSIRRPYQYVLVNSPSVSAAHSRSGVVAMYVTYTNSGFPMILLLLICFKPALQLVQRLQSIALILADPALVDLVDWRRVQIVQLLAATPDCDDQISRLQQREMLRDGLAGHAELLAQLVQRLAILCI